MAMSIFSNLQSDTSSSHDSKLNTADTKRHSSLHNINTMDKNTRQLNCLDITIVSL
jgi:hypothetical protein